MGGSNGNPFTPTFSSNISTPSTTLPVVEKFASSASKKCQSNERRRFTVKRPFSPQKTPPSSSFSFQNPLVFSAGNADKKENLDKAKCGNAKTKSTVSSAVTGTIPSYFEGSAYSSQTLEPSCVATDESTDKRRDEKCDQNSAASQIMVSRLLRGIPQSLYFWPLRGYSKVAKQSLIKSWDRIFEDSVDQIQSLQLTSGFCIAAKRLWDTTQDLQMMGYNVVPLRRRLVELSDVVQQRTKLRVEKTRLKGKATLHMMENNKLEFEIVKLKAKIEAEKASFEDVMYKVAKMEDEMPNFNALFSKMAIKPL